MNVIHYLKTKNYVLSVQFSKKNQVYEKIILSIVPKFWKRV